MHKREMVTPFVNIIASGNGTIGNGNSKMKRNIFSIFSILSNGRNYYGDTFDFYGVRLDADAVLRSPIKNIHDLIGNLVIHNSNGIGLNYLEAVKYVKDRDIKMFGDHIFNSRDFRYEEKLGKVKLEFSIEGKEYKCDLAFMTLDKHLKFKPNTIYFKIQNYNSNSFYMYFQHENEIFLLLGNTSLNKINFSPYSIFKDKNIKVINEMISEVLNVNGPYKYVRIKVDGGYIYLNKEFIMSNPKCLFVRDGYDVPELVNMDDLYELDDITLEYGDDAMRILEIESMGITKTSDRYVLTVDTIELTIWQSEGGDRSFDEISSSRERRIVQSIENLEYEHEGMSALNERYTIFIPTKCDTYYHRYLGQDYLKYLFESQCKKISDYIVELGSIDPSYLVDTLIFISRVNEGYKTHIPTYTKYEIEENKDVILHGIEAHKVFRELGFGVIDFTEKNGKQILGSIVPDIFAKEYVYERACSYPDRDLAIEKSSEEDITTVNKFNKKLFNIFGILGDVNFFKTM